MGCIQAWAGGAGLWGWCPCGDGPERAEVLGGAAVPAVLHQHPLAQRVLGTGCCPKGQQLLLCSPLSPCPSVRLASSAEHTGLAMLAGGAPLGDVGTGTGAVSGWQPLV